MFAASTDSYILMHGHTAVELTDTMFHFQQRHPVPTVVPVARRRTHLQITSDSLSSLHSNCIVSKLKTKFTINHNEHLIWMECLRRTIWLVGWLYQSFVSMCTQVHSFTCSWTNSAGLEQTGFLSHCCSVSVLATLRNMYTCMYTFPMKSSHATFLIKITCLFWWTYLESSSLVAVVKPVQECGSAIALQLHASNGCENQFVWGGS